VPQANVQGDGKRRLLPFFVLLALAAGALYWLSSTGLLARILNAVAPALS
jgi:hypothetical protein